MGAVAVIVAPGEDLSDDDLAALLASSGPAAVAGASDAPATLVFVHGLGGSQTTWATVLGNFAENYRVVALDLPGHGASSKLSPDEGGDYSVPALAAALGEVIEKLDLAPAVVVGHSLGGAAALDLALTRPKLVRGVVLVNSAGLGT